MPVQGTAGNFSARMNVPRRLQVTPQTTSANNVNGLPPQNGMSPQSNFSQGRTCFLSALASIISLAQSLLHGYCYHNAS